MRYEMRYLICAVKHTRYNICRGVLKYAHARKPISEIVDCYICQIQIHHYEHLDDVSARCCNCNKTRYHCNRKPA